MKSGTVFTDQSDDLGSITIDWGEKHSDTEITAEPGLPGQPQVSEFPTTRSVVAAR